MNKLLTKYRRLIFLSLAVLALTPWTLQAQEQASIKLGLYVVVDDMVAAKQFYRQLFRVEPSVDYGNFVSFRLGEGIFALYSEKVYSHKLSRGNNVVPYIQVDNIQAEFERVRQLSPKMINKQIIDEGAIKLFMFADPSGNVIEFFALP